MKPIYLPDFVRNPNSVIGSLEQLDWLSLTEARKEYFMSTVLREYTYGKFPHARTYTSHAYTGPVAALQTLLNEIHGTEYNVCFLNRYDSQKNQLGWHADDSPSMAPNHPIAVVSLGAEREIWWKPRSMIGPIPPEQRQKLGHGSLFIMPAGFQDEYLHRIPRADRAVGMRISLTFRKYV